jgi:hypothetical protein
MPDPERRSSSGPPKASSHTTLIGKAAGRCFHIWGKQPSSTTPQNGKEQEEANSFPQADGHRGYVCLGLLLGVA